MQKSLFNPITLRKLCSKVEVSDFQKEEAKKWLSLIEKESLENEKSNYLIFTKIILENILGYESENLNHEVGNIEFSYPKGEKTILGIEVKGAKVRDIFAKQNRNKEWHDTPVHQLWTYMGEMNLDYGIVTNYKTFILIDKNEGSASNHVFDFMDIRNNEEKLKEFIAIFSKDHLITKRIVEDLKAKSKIEERIFTNEFYKLFSETRLMLIKEFQENGATKDESIHYSQLVLNRLMFVFFCEDTGKMEERLFENIVSKVLQAGILAKDFLGTLICNQIKFFFRKLDKGSTALDENIFGFNGGLFNENIPDKVYFKDLRDKSFFEEIYKDSKLKEDIKLNPEMESLVNEYENKLNPVVINLLLMSSFDFKTEVSVNILGHIFEQSLSDIEKLKEGEIISKRKKDGIFYTPEYITDYICRNTIIPYLAGNKDIITAKDLVREYSSNISELEEKFKSIKILDTTCGSGAFLIKSVDILIEIHKEIQDFKEAEGEYSTSDNNKRRKKNGKKDTKDFSQFTFDKWNEEDEARNIIENNIFGVDINEESVEVTKLSLFLKIAKKNKKLIDLSNRIKCGNSLIEDSSFDSRAFNWKTEFKEVMDNGGFDIIIGNPPYGAKLTKEEQNYFKEKYNIGSTDTAQLMMKKSFDLLKDNGVNGFIIPKAFIFASNWKIIRDLFLPNLKLLVDCKKVWDEVKLEQIIYIIKKSEFFDNYSINFRDKEEIVFKGIINKEYCKQFGFILNNISSEELDIGLKIKNIGVSLNDLSTNQRGDDLQQNIKESGKYKVLGGANIKRYSLSDVKGYISEDIQFKEKAIVKDNSVIVQNIIAHIENPVDHIKIIATIVDENYLIVDTVNQISPNEGISNKYILALLNSKLISWYVYRFIFAKAIRTMHFDNAVTSRIFVPLITLSDQVPFIEKADLLLNLSKEFNFKKDKFLNRIKTNFSIEIDNKLNNFYSLSFAQFNKEIAKRKIKLSLKQQDEWEDYFKGYKIDLTNLEEKITEVDKTIDEMVYRLYGLNEREIATIENTEL
jgi:hypothetical protein